MCFVVLLTGNASLQVDQLAHVGVKGTEGTSQENFLCLGHTRSPATLAVSGDDLATCGRELTSVSVSSIGQYRFLGRQVSAPIGLPIFLAPGRDMVNFVERPGKASR
ncbi:hypothetical protein D3C80_1527320 [compost metagenome]